MHDHCATDHSGSPIPGLRSVPSVAHFDLDAFFASVEQRDKPSLAHQPVVVGGLGARGVVATASYEARQFGVRSAMPMARARQLCPQGYFLAPRLARYQQFSQAVMEILRELSPLVEPMGLDEAYVDLAVANDPPDTPEEVATRLAVCRRRVRAQLQLAISAGAGPSKLIAKLASDRAKPDALRVVTASDQEQFLRHLEVRDIPGIGPATTAKLATLGVTTIADLAMLPRATLCHRFGLAHGNELHQLARGIDTRPVNPARERKSVGTEETFPKDLREIEPIRRALDMIARRVAHRLERSGPAGRTVTLKVRTADFVTHTRAVTFHQAVCQPHELYDAVVPLLEALRAEGALAGGVRLLGISVSSLGAAYQPSLFPPEDVESATPPSETGRSDDDLRPGADVIHPQYGPGWVRTMDGPWVTVRFEGPGTGPGRERTFDRALSALAPYQLPSPVPDEVCQRSQSNPPGE